MPITMAVAQRTPKLQCQPKRKVIRLSYDNSNDGRTMAMDTHADYTIYRADYNSTTGILRAYASNRRVVVLFIPQHHLCDCDPLPDQHDYSNTLRLANVLVGLGFFKVSGQAYDAVGKFTNFHIKKQDDDGHITNVINGKMKASTQ